MQTKQDVGWPSVLFAYKQSRCMFYLCSVRHKRSFFQMEKQCKNGNNFRLCQLSGQFPVSLKPWQLKSLFIYQQKKNFTHQIGLLWVFSSNLRKSGKKLHCLNRNCTYITQLTMESFALPDKINS